MVEGRELARDGAFRIFDGALRGGLVDAVEREPVEHVGELVERAAEDDALASSLRERAQLLAEQVEDVDVLRAQRLSLASRGDARRREPPTAQPTQFRSVRVASLRTPSGRSSIFAVTM